MIRLIRKMFSLAKETFSVIFRLTRSPVKGFKAFYGVSLYRNAVYLILNNVVGQATGFFFWMAAARLYSTEAVGMASAAIAAMTLLATLSTMGLDFSLIRFLPGAGKQARDMINTCFTISGVASIALAFVFIAGLGFWSPALISIRQHPIFLSIFVISVAASTLNAFSQQTFIAKRRAGLALTRGLVFGFSRFVPLVIMATFFKSFGIFSAWGIAVSLAVVISLLSITKIEAGYYPLPIVKKEMLSDMARFSFTNYIANLILSIPILIFPMMVVNLVGAEQNAYFYIGWALGFILFMIPSSLSISLFAEGSHHRDKLSQEIVRSLKLVMLILIPAMILMLVVGDKLLLLFGRAYSENATNLLRILAFSALPYAVNQIYFSMKRVEMQMRIVIILSLFMAVVTLGLSWVLLPRMGITGIGIAWLVSQGMVAIGIIINFILRRNPKRPT
jgi:O-antigen/teichoic acid export membrane protein